MGRTLPSGGEPCACAPLCASGATITEFSPYMDDYCDDCTLHRCDVVGHPDETADAAG